MTRPDALSPGSPYPPDTLAGHLSPAKDPRRRLTGAPLLAFSTVGPLHFEDPALVNARFDPGDVTPVHEPGQMITGGLVGDVEFFGQLADVQGHPAAIVDEPPEMAVHIGEGDPLPATPAIEALGVCPKGRVLSLGVS